MGLTNSRGKRPARLHSSMIGTRFSSINLRAVSRTRRSSSLSNVSKFIKSTPRNLMAGIKFHSTSQQTANGKLIKVAEGTEVGNASLVGCWATFGFEATGNH